MRIMKPVLILMILSFSLSAAAQTDCPALIRTALETAGAACAGIGRNQLCYGNDSLTAVHRENVSDVSFAKPGDLMGIDSLQTLRLSPFNLSTGSWGMALMDVQANLPAILPDQYATFLLFGDVEIDNIGQALQITADIVAPNPINVRSTPSTRSAIVTLLDPGAIVTANGRNTAGDWIHIRADDSEEGWVAAYLLHSDADLTTLNVVDNGSPIYASMQAFRLRTGIGDAGCAESPNSGLLIQVPEDAGEIALRVDDVDIQLSATAFLQAEAGNALFINILEGTGTVSALDKSVIVPAGAVSSVALDENLAPSAPPVAPVPYNPDDLQSLPISLMPRQIEIVEPLLQGQINHLTGCRITSTVEGTNFRGGPGTAYFATGTLTMNNPYRVNGQANGLDGYVWWRITNRRWVRADVVTTSGNCGDVPVIEARPAMPSTSGVSTDLTCTSERVIYAHPGDTIPIVDSYASSDVSVGAIVATIFVDGHVAYEGTGAASGSGIVWNTSWVATSGVHNVEVRYTPTVEIHPDWATNPFEPGESWSHIVCQIRVD